MTFAMPDRLTSVGYGLRDETEADLPFLRALYAATRADEFAATGWDDAQTRAFTDQQFVAQRRHYRGIAHCRFAIITRAGTPVGRLYIEERVTQWHIVDIALVPSACGAGLGTAILEAIADAACAVGKDVGIFVEINNRARRLYDRLGYTPIRATGFHVEMERIAVAPVS